MRKTVGALAFELAQKSPDSRNPIEIQRAILKPDEYLKNLIECAQNFKDTATADFYIVVHLKKERLLPNTFRNLWAAQHSCPTPNYDQTVYVYRKESENIEFIWTIPDRGTCHYLRYNAALVSSEEKQLLKFVLDFADGTLYALCKKLNGEEKESSLLE